MFVVLGCVYEDSEECAGYGDFWVEAVRRGEEEAVQLSRVLNALGEAVYSVSGPHDADSSGGW